MKWDRIAAPAQIEPIDPAIEQAFAALGERKALRLFERLSDRFSYSHGHDAIYEAVREIAHDAAQAEGWIGDDLAERYLGSGRD